MGASAATRTANVMCGALAYVQTGLCWLGALVFGFYTWILASALENPTDDAMHPYLALVVVLGATTLVLVAWPIVYLWLYDRWQAKRGL